VTTHLWQFQSGWRFPATNSLSTGLTRNPRGSRQALMFDEHLSIAMPAAKGFGPGSGSHFGPRTLRYGQSAFHRVLAC
jgi:hypothetical protein